MRSKADETLVIVESLKIVGLIAKKKIYALSI